MGTPRLDPDREVALVGGVLAAASGLVLLASPFVDWYQRATFCDVNGCGLNVSGFSALGATSALLVSVGVAGLLVAPAALVGGAARRAVSGLAGAGGLGVALLVLFRIVVVPSVGSMPTGARLAGIFIALLGAVGVTGSAALAGIGRRVFDRAPFPYASVGVVVCASAAMIASLFVPWVREKPPPFEGFVVRTLTAWHVAPTLAVVLLLGGIALICASALVALIRWRAAFFALAVGGWLGAAIAVVGTVLAARVPGPHGAVDLLVAYEPGYYACLAGAAVIVFAGVWTAIALSDN